jgi:hypothetical protein
MRSNDIKQLTVGMSGGRSSLCPPRTHSVLTSNVRWVRPTTLSEALVDVNRRLIPDDHEIA